MTVFEKKTKDDYGISKMPVMLGTWAWGNDGSFGDDYSEEELKSVFSKAVSAGFTMFDTAYVYGYGRSEERLGHFINDTERKRFCISDKFTPYHAKDFPEDPVGLMLEKSLKNLGTDYIDIYWIHNPIDYRQWLPRMAELQKEGRISQIGLSNFGLEELRDAERILGEYELMPYGIQNHYSLLSRSSESAGIIDYCRAKSIKFFSYMVLEQGALTGKYNEEHPFIQSSLRGKNYNKVLGRYEKLNGKLEEIAEGYGINIAALSIAWGVAKGTIPIIGVTKKEHLEDILSAVKVKLREEDVLLMEAAAAESKLKTTRMWERVYM